MISTEQAPAMVLPKNFLRPCLLLLLRERPAHGYDLLERLAPLGYGREDPGRLYRALRALESDELVSSAWEKSKAGPDRRIYELTPAGRDVLNTSARDLRVTGAILNLFLARFGADAGTQEPQRPAAKRRRPGDPR